MVPVLSMTGAIRSERNPLVLLIIGQTKEFTLSVMMKETQQLLQCSIRT